jgi:Kae1-associated kinase Bud32
VSPEGELLQVGAEAEIRAVTWRGREAVSKRRIPKGYRHADIDKVLRASRTKAEARLMAAAREAGVPTPVILDVDVDGYEIIMERVRGPTLKKVLEDAEEGRGKGRGKGKDGAPGLDSICERLGTAVAAMHKGNVVHGDLTAANMIMDEGADRIVFIDFGLGERTRELEPRGMDLHVLMEAFKAINLERHFEKVTAAYVRAFGDGGKEVVERMEAIAGRGRYA